MNQPRLKFKGVIFYIYDAYCLVQDKDKITIEKIGQVRVSRRSQAVAFKKARAEFGRSVSNVILVAKEREVKELSATDPEVMAIVKKKGISKIERVEL